MKIGTQELIHDVYAHARGNSVIVVLNGDGARAIHLGRDGKAAPVEVIFE